MYGPEKQPFYCDRCGEIITNKEQIICDADGIPYHDICSTYENFVNYQHYQRLLGRKKYDNQSGKMGTIA